MATQAQIRANQQNARKSTGPRTPQGKAAVARNAVKHGLYTSAHVIEGEDHADFDRFRRDVLDYLKPVGPLETSLAERIVTLIWRLRRIERIQNQATNVLILKADPDRDPLGKFTRSLVRKAVGADDPDPPESDPPSPLGRMAAKDFAGPGVLERLLMYERRLEHSLYRTNLELQRLTLIRKLGLPETDLPRPLSGPSARTNLHELCKTNPISGTVK